MQTKCALGGDVSGKEVRCMIDSLCCSTVSSSTVEVAKMSFESQNAPTKHARLKVANCAAPDRVRDFSGKETPLEVCGLQMSRGRTVLCRLAVRITENSQGLSPMLLIARD